MLVIFIEIPILIWKKKNIFVLVMVVMTMAVYGENSTLARSSCQNPPSAATLMNRVDTTARLLQLRTMMASVKVVRGVPLKAYIITSDDEHQVWSIIIFF